MAEKDMAEKALIAYNDVFADIVNNLLFDGDAVVSVSDLQDARTRQPYKSDSREVRDQDRDNCKLWVKDEDSAQIRLSYFGIESETVAEDDMPFRVIGYDGASYRDQIYHYTDKEGKRHKSVERYPVVTLVLYMGYDSHWDKAKSLYEAFTGSVPKRLRPFVWNYGINLFEIAYLTDKQVARFKSDFWIVADYFTQMRKNNGYVPSERQLTHVREVLDLMRILTGDNRFTEHVDKFEKCKEAVTMCKVLDEVERKGISIGEKRGERRGERRGEKKAKLLDIKNVMESLGVSLEKAMDVLKIPADQRPMYAEMVNKK